MQSVDILDVFAKHLEELGGQYEIFKDDAFSNPHLRIWRGGNTKSILSSTLVVRVVGTCIEIDKKYRFKDSKPVLMEFDLSDPDSVDKITKAILYNL